MTAYGEKQVSGPENEERGEQRTQKMAYPLPPNQSWNVAPYAPRPRTAAATTILAATRNLNHEGTLTMWSRPSRSAIAKSVDVRVRSR